MNLKTLHKIGYGMYVVGAKAGGKLNGQIANTVFQVCAEPPVIAVCINKQNLTNQFIREGKVFAVSILSEETPMKFIGQFGFKSGREVDKFKDVRYEVGVTGAPVVLENSVGHIEAELMESTEMGTHTVFFGKVVGAEILNENPPMTYTYYHQVKRGKSPKSAPTYIKEVNGKEVSKVEKYRCTVCGYIYDPEKGDPDSGIEPGTAFEDIPDDWVCPICGAAKVDFELVKD